MGVTGWMIVGGLLLLAGSLMIGLIVGGSLTASALASRDVDDEERYRQLVGWTADRRLAELRQRVVDRDEKIDQLAGMLSICEAELSRVEAELEVERRRRLKAEMRNA